MGVPKWLTAFLLSFASGAMFSAWLICHKDIYIYIAILDAIVLINRIDIPHDWN